MLNFPHVFKSNLYILKLPSSATILATTTIEPDSDLEQMRAWIERFSKEEEEEEVRIYDK